MAAKSIEEQVEDLAKTQLKKFGIRYFTKNESLNTEIDGALKKADSKSGGRGGNFPDIKVFLEMPNHCYIPVVIEVKGMSRCLEKKNPEHEITNLTKKGEPDYAAIQKYAVNGAVHYAEAIINYTESYDHVVAVGINGYRDDTDQIRMEYGVYYVSRDNMLIPKKIAPYTDLSFLCHDRLERLQQKIEEIFLSEEEKERRAFTLENRIETVLQKLNQKMHDHLNIKAESRVQLVCGMIMAALGVKDRVSPLEIGELKGNLGEHSNDGITTLITNHMV